MILKSEQTDQPFHDLDAHLDIKSATDLKARLAKFADLSGDLMLGAGQVTRMSTPAIQVLAAFILSMAERGRKVSVSNPSQIFTETFGCLGLSHLLQTKK